MLKELPDCPKNGSDYAYEEDLCDVDPSKLLLEYVGRSFQGNYSCEGLNAAGWGPASDTEELIIYCNYIKYIHCSVVNIFNIRPLFLVVLLN